MNPYRPLRFMLPLLVAAVTIVLAPVPLHAADPPGLPDGWSDGYAYANGVRIHYYHAKPAPEKPVIVMVHGITDFGLSWATTALALQDDYDIYMVDARGHGLSDPFTPSGDGDTLIKDVVEFVRAMDFEKPILMGHSMGAATVMRVGAEYPDLAQAVVMLDPGIPRAGGGRGGARRGGQRGAPGAGRQGDGRRGGDGRSGGRRGAPQGDDSEPTRLTISMSGSPETLVAQNNYDFDELVALCRDSRHPGWSELDCQYWALGKKQYHGAYSNELFAVMSGAMRTGDSLGEIPVPVLILKADTSPEGRAANEEAVNAVVQNGKIVHIDEAGHNLHQDEPERTVTALREFLSTL